MKISTLSIIYIIMEVLTEYCLFRMLNEDIKLRIGDLGDGYEMVRESDAVIAEITAPSHGVGLRLVSQRALGSRFYVSIGN